MSYGPSAGGQPPSFKTNVNRAKTKRWVEAKSYSYDGDDWGEMDEYDEYGGYDEPAPPSRPTGLRQRGQSASREQQGVYQQQQPGYGNPAPSQHGYPNMGPQGSMQQPQSARSVTNPPYQTSRMARPGSFDHGDERRAFSAAMPHQGAGPSPGATRDYPNDSAIPHNYHSQQEPPDFRQSQPMEAHESQFPPERHHPQSIDNRPPPISDQPRRTSMGSRTQSMNSNTPSVDFHNRRDFSPSAVPPPLHTRGSPSPHNRADPNSAWRPPRKSSLSQNTQPDRGYDSHDAAPPAHSDLEERELPSRGRADSDTNKALPLIRPVDIYRRMQEEKERERQSQESSRPSMDAIIGDTRSEDEPTRDSGRVSERGQEVEPARRSRSTLDPVAERKSEYGMSGLPQTESESKGEPAEHQTFSGGDTAKAAEAQKIPQSFKPQLPDVARMSGFGELFSKPALRPEGTPDLFTGQETTSSVPHPPQPSDTQPDTYLQHQPSLGLRSVVHQAFDTSSDPVPETPSSSTADSSIGRSGSGGTSTVSPIISRGSSSANTHLQSRGPPWRPETPQAGHGPESVEDRPTSSDSLRTPTAIPRKLSPHLANQQPGSFIPGHRRDLSTPSPDNSPARTPNVEANKQLQQPQEAELAMTTPIETQFPYTNDPYGERTSRTSPTKPFDTGTADLPTLRSAQGGIATTGTTGPFKSTPTEAPKSPAESTRSRVRNLADKFESGRSSPAGSDRAPSPVKTNFNLGPASLQPRPLATDRMESFRPKLPGGWESSVSLTTLDAPRRPEATSAPVPLEQRLQNTATGRSGQSATPTETKGRQIETARGSDSRPLQAADESSATDPFTSLAAAGSALAGALSSVIGSGYSEGDKDGSLNQPQEVGQQPTWKGEHKDSKVAIPREVSRNTAFLPEASKPAMLDTPDDGTSSIMPTPLDKLPESAPRQQGKNTDYFGGAIAPKQQWSVDSYNTEKTTSTERSQLTPALSVDTRPQYESDRLRREIIRELSPRVTDESIPAQSNLPVGAGPSSQSKPNVPSHPHESMVIPPEYDHYWNGSGSEESSRASSVRHPSKTTRDETAPPLPSAEPQLIQQTTQGRPDLPLHRFSFEGPIQPINQGQRSLHDNSNPAHQPISRSSSPVPQPIESTLPPQNTTDDHPIHLEHEDEHSPLENNSSNTVSIDPSSALQRPGGSDLSSVLRDLPPETAEAQSHLDPEEPAFGARTAILPQPSHTTSALPPRQPNVPPEIQNFREILALKNPRDRINCYDEYREHIANVETGLAHWLAVTTAKLPEHQDILPSGRMLATLTVGHKPSPARSKLGGLLSSGNSSAPQPYYQQYLSASSPAGASDGVPPSRGNSSSFYTPSTSTGKLSAQQVQARGKDLLHSAGVFGGKANVAAKGLFSKGKSKFRGGNADKAPISSFNTNYNQGAQPQAQPLGTFPIPSKSPSISEQPPSSEQSTSSRPTSFVAHPEHQPLGTSRQETHQEPESAPLDSPRVPGDDHSVTDSLSGSGQTGSPEPSVRPDLAKVTPSEETSPMDNALHIRPQALQQTRDSATRNAPTVDQVKETQIPQPSANSNRTPTQQDYADYIRRGSSPTVQIPEVKRMESDQKRSNRDNVIQQTVVPQYKSEPHSPPALRSKYSTQKSGEGSSTNRNRVDNDHDPPLTGSSRTTQGSEHSEGTFPTGGSALNHQPADRMGSDVGQSVPSQGREDSVEPSETESSSSGSIKATTPIAVPAANIHDQTRARPFSFIQFSQNTTPQPLEDYSHRRPSVDSTPSQLDSEQDVPPSPVSSRQSVVHEPTQPQMSGPTAHRPDPPQPFSRPLQDSSLQGHPGFRQERNATAEENMPAQHYPTPIPRAETVTPRQQVTEYSLEGVGPPPVPRTTTNNTSPSSKRGSRSSAFFRSFKNPTETAAPTTFVEKHRPNDDRHQGEPTIRNSKSKRGSLFRSLTKGSKASSSEDAGQRSQESPQPMNTQVNPAPTTDRVSRDEIPTSMPSKNPNRLSKTATAKETEQKPQEPGKKKRFSAIGSLFGRSKDRGRTSVQSGIPQQVPESAQVSDVQLQGRNKRLSSSIRPVPKEPPTHGPHHQSTRESLVKEGLLPKTSRQSSAKSTEPSAYSQDSAQRQRAFPPRALIKSQNSPTVHTGASKPAAPESTKQCRSAIYKSPIRASPTRSKPTCFVVHHNDHDDHERSYAPYYHHYSSAELYEQFLFPLRLSPAATTTTKGCLAATEVTAANFHYHDYLATEKPEKFQRTCFTPRSQQRSSYDDRSPPPVARDSIDPPLQTTNYWKPSPQASNIGNLPQEQPYRPHSSNMQDQPRQTLPPLQTSMSGPSVVPAAQQPHAKNNSAGSDPEARKLRRSQIESGYAATTTSRTMEQPQSSTAAAGPKEGGNARTGGGRNVGNGENNDEEPVVMSATSFPGQEWQPMGYGAWDEY
ncbi:MAG: hypothetical protein LQ350_007562 [Teloschistes chrysophthalmus]|nr:MAG: hypothetical protein LQ350_007562 [Niorma chrysophthalma]